MKIVECVPNFSEGRDRALIDRITATISAVDDVKLLDVDPGADTNRTVVTFVGTPDAAVEAAFQAIAMAAELIDMRQHTGAHARQGATDVCPFVPVSGVTMEDCAELARRLGQRVGEELAIPVYLYGHAASRPERLSLPDIRKGEYEALQEKLTMPEWAPDFGPATFHARAGATAIGARKFLIAYNINLNTRQTKIAKDIALRIREKGGWARGADGKILRDEGGRKVRHQGLFRECQATGWYIPEFHRAQVTMNLTDFHVSPPHEVFDEVCRLATERGVRVTGSELVGLLPLEALGLAGHHYLAKQGASRGVPDADVIQTAVQSLGLDELYPFEPEKKIIEYAFSVGDADESLVKMRVDDFADELSRDSAAPGGGSVAALCGSLGAGLAAMVANLTHGKKGYEASWTKMDAVARGAQAAKKVLLRAVDEDTAAFNRVMAAFALPRKRPEDKERRAAAIEEANQGATLVPLSVLERSLGVLFLAETAIDLGNRNSLSDAGVAALMARAAADGAYYNVLINLQGLSDEGFIAQTRARADDLHEQAVAGGDLLQQKVLDRLG